MKRAHVARPLSAGMLVRWAAVLTLGAALCGDGALADEGQQGGPAAVAAVRAVADSFVRVEVFLQYDNGEEPEDLSSGGFVSVGDRGNYAGLIAEKRPLEMPGILLAPDRVLVEDLQLHPRFVRTIEVVFKDQRVGARVAALGATSDGAFLGLDRALEGAKPLGFKADAPGPYRAVSYAKEDGAWGFTACSTLEQVTVTEERGPRGGTCYPAVLVDRQDVAVGVALGGSLPLDGSWRGSPLAWPMLAAEDIAARQDEMRTLTGRALLRVHVTLRSPKGDESGGSYRRFMRDDEEESATERNAAGILVDARRVLVLDKMDASTTARVEAIEAYADGAAAVPAKFVCSLKDFGAYVVEAEQPLDGAARASKRPLRSYRDEILFTAKLEFQGERRILYRSHNRISGFRTWWSRMLVPSFGSDAKDHYLFDREGALVAFPLGLRSTGSEPRYSFGRRWSSGEGEMVAAADVLAMLADPMAHADPDNVPLSAEQENRLAWLGVEIQRLDRDLARANGVSHLTKDGASGALVSYVYAGSPAAEGGIEPGAVLLRIHAPDKPEPIEIEAEEDYMSRFGGLLSGLGSVPDEFFDRFSGGPWPSIDSSLNRSLTGIGFGKTFTLEYAVGGEVRRKDLVVTVCPPHSAAAAHFKSEALGVTVKDLTFEVRRYFQLAEDAPGVIVAKVERGGRTAVAGLHRFDVVTRVNDQAVVDVKSFEKAVGDGGELRFAVKDKLKERIVKVAATAK